MDPADFQGLCPDEELRAPAGLALERYSDGRSGVLLLSFPLRGPACARLTRTERCVARDVVLGLSNQAIARRRAVSVHTIANQLAGMFRKLGVHSRLDLARCIGGARRPEVPATVRKPAHSDRIPGLTASPDTFEPVAHRSASSGAPSAPLRPGEVSPRQQAIPRGEMAAAVRFGSGPVV
jgi:DNA-binding CsgD family transcriptional regulator